MRIPLLALLLSVALMGCGSDTPAPPPPPPAPAALPPAHEPRPPVTSVMPVEEPTEAAATTGEIDDIRAEYARLQELLVTGQLAVDTLPLPGMDDPCNAELLHYREGGAEPVLIALTYDDGSHAGGEQFWYLRDGRPFFVYVGESYWRFGGPEDADGQAGTTDEFAEERRYYGPDGKLLRQLRKDYTVNSWEDEQPTSDGTPNTAVDVEPGTSYDEEWLRTLVNGDLTDCPFELF